MLRNFAKPTVFLIGISLSAVLVSPAEAQSSPTIVKVYTSPYNLIFSVDGALYNRSAVQLWTPGSQHVLQVANTIQVNGDPSARYVFHGWQAGGQSIQGNPITITADPSVTEYEAVFDVSYSLIVSFFTCDTPVCTGGPGTVAVNGQVLTSSQQLFISSGSAVSLTASPNAGYLFGSWNISAPAVSNGSQASLTMTQPAVVSVFFLPVRHVTLATSPPGLLVLGDGAPAAAPAGFDWGLNTDHSVAAISPQTDSSGIPWVFSSWSDGGAAYHAYNPGWTYTGQTLTATFVRGVAMAVETSPRGLSLTVDGGSKWPSSLFTWGVGQVHTVSAPERQTDAQNRAWQFSAWSNGGAATQDFTVPAEGVPAGFALIATYTPLGHLMVDSTLPGIALTVNGAACSLPCDVKQAVGSTVTVSAPANVAAGMGTRESLSGWSNGAGPGDLQLTLGPDPISVTAQYHVMNNLNAISSPAGAATWTYDPASTDGYYDSQATVKITIAPRPGYKFQYWSGDLGGTALSGSVNMAQPRSVEAVFDKVPYLVPAGVTNGAGVTPQAGVAPGSVISIFGANLSADSMAGPASPMVQTLDGVTVRVGDRLLPLFFVSPGQINAQLPADLAPGKAVVTVSSEGQPDVTAQFSIVADAPGLFPQMLNNKAYAIALRADGSMITPANPAARGEWVTIYGTGFGPTSVPRPVGLAVPASPALTVSDPVGLAIGGITVPVARAYALVGSVAVDAVSFTLGKDVPSGDQPLVLTVGDQPSNTVLLAVQ
jgi:uncharacterized protein (TIGR03437 family)